MWTPAYATYWGWRNFFALCDTAAALGSLGLLTGNRLLVSSQALPSLMVGVLWSSDVAARLAAGKHVFGGTEYMWDQRVPLAVRLLSLFHIGLPLALVAALRRMDGYDRRALPLQAALTVPLLLAGRLMPPAKNLNYAFRDPLFGRALGPAPLHLGIILVGTVVLIYLPSHLALSRALPAKE